MKSFFALLVTVGFACCASAALAQDPSYCPTVSSSGAEVIRLEDSLGCELISQLALKTVVSDGGYLKQGDYVCRWGQGGTRPELIDGKTYYAGYCNNLSTEEEVWYRGRRLGDSAAQRVYVGSAYKPKRRWCPTNRTCLTNIKWSTYSSTRAVGVGRGRECGGGGTGCRTYRKLKVVLTAPASMCDRIQFSKLRMFGRTFTAGDAPLCDVYYAP